MELLYRTASPAYRGCPQQPAQASTSFLSGMWCSLFGSATPAYHTTGMTSASAPAAPRCFWQAFPASPSYKAPPPDTSSNPEPTLSPSSDDVIEGEDCDTCPGDGVPTQIFVW